MPNHVTNKVRIEGPSELLAEIRDFVNGVDSTDGSSKEEPFCFDKIVPMPKHIFRGNLGEKERKEHGKDNWYDWSRENWGTKWGAYSHEEVVEEDDTIIFQFDTAWSLPEPIYIALSEKYPSVYITVEVIDEGWGFAGTVFYHNGEMIDEDWLECDANNDDFCDFHSELKGWDPRHEE